MKGVILIVAALLLAFTEPSSAVQPDTDEVRIGILSWRGPLGFRSRWEPFGAYLSKKIDRSVVILPLEFKEVLPAVEKEEVDFFTADPSVFMTAKTQYGATEILTMKVINADFVGAVLFTAADNQEVNTLSDLKNKKFGAIQRWSFGGWQMAEKEFLDAGIDPYPFLHTLRFFDTPWAVAKAVLQRKVDAGTVPASILERMAAAGTVKMENFKILQQKFHPNFPYVCSTKLYPGFPLAKTTAVDQALADQVAAALKALSPGDRILRNIQVAGWIDPLDYTGINMIQSQLRGGGYTGRRKL